MTDEFLVPSEHLDEILLILSSTKWDQDFTDDMNDQRNRLYELIRVEKVEIFEEAETAKGLITRKKDPTYKGKKFSKSDYDFLILSFQT